MDEKDELKRLFELERIERDERRSLEVRAGVLIAAALVGVNQLLNLQEKHDATPMWIVLVLAVLLLFTAIFAVAVLRPPSRRKMPDSTDLVGLW